MGHAKIIMGLGDLQYQEGGKRPGIHDGATILTDIPAPVTKSINNNLIYISHLGVKVYLLCAKTAPGGSKNGKHERNLGFHETKNDSARYKLAFI